MIAEASSFSLEGGFFFVFKASLLVLVFLYFIFSLIVTRQVKLMTETLMTQSALLLKFLSWVHSLASIAVFVYLSLFL